ncbi:hypothetical protein [Nocardiopsis trehalosi]|uniref:hypothetical protein n=1 Tax=Nocardiopsis trehalosi TaxID=109329 RepID=UPI000833509F|nr:hypothetical protein [Nocardiopsis trehalosi]
MFSTFATHLPAVLVGVVGLALIPKIPPARRGLAITGLALLALYGVLEILATLFVHPPIAPMPMVFTLLGVVVTLSLMAAFLLLLLAAARRPAAPRSAPHGFAPAAGPYPPGPAFPPPGGPVGGPPPHAGPAAPPAP